jgi:hypothetical protein
MNERLLTGEGKPALSVRMWVFRAVKLAERTLHVPLSAPEICGSALEQRQPLPAGLRSHAGSCSYNANPYLRCAGPLAEATMRDGEKWAYGRHGGS